MQYKWIALSVTTVGTLMAGIDARILIVGLPTVAKDLGADVDQVVWVSQAYLLASTVGLLLIGRTTDIVGRVKIFNIGFAIFTIGSAFASLSTTPVELISARVVQGVGSSMIFTNSTAILTDATPTTELGTILGISQIAYAIGATLGLTLSGVLITIADWRALFYINIPIGMFGTIWGHKRLREISSKDYVAKMDWSGFLTFTGGVTLLLLAITFMSYGLAPDLTVGILVLICGVILLSLFVKIENASVMPLLDLHLFKIKEFAAGNLAWFFNSLTWSGFTILLSFYMQAVLDYSPLRTGLTFLPLDIALLTTVLSGKLSDRYGAGPFVIIGSLMRSAGLLMISTPIVSTNYAFFTIVLLFEGIGFGIFLAPNTSRIMSAVPSNRRGIASAFRNTLGNVGQTASTGLVVLIITLAIPYSAFSELVRGVEPYSVAQLAKEQFTCGFRLACLILAFLNMVPILFTISTRWKFNTDQKNRRHISERDTEVVARQ